MAFNYGIDAENPNGRLMTYDEAVQECPSGWRLPTAEEALAISDMCVVKIVKDKTITLEK